MPPRQRRTKSTTPAGDRRAIAASRNSQQKPRVRRRSARRSGPLQDDESDERMSVALTIATMADLFNGKHSIHSNGDSSADGGRPNPCKSSKHYVDSNVPTSVDVVAGSKDDRILPSPQPRRLSTVLGIVRDNNKGSDSVVVSNKTENKIVVSNASGKILPPAVGRSVTAPQKDVTDQPGGRRQVKKTDKVTGQQKMPPTTSIVGIAPPAASVGNIATSTSCGVAVFDNRVPEVSTLPLQPLQAISMLDFAAASGSGVLPVLMAPILLPDGSIRLVPITDSAIHVVSGIVAPASNNLVPSGENLLASQPQVVTAAVLKTGGSGSERPVAEPRRIQSGESAADVGSSAGDGARPGLGSLSSLRNFYRQPKTNSTAEAGEGAVSDAGAPRAGSPAKSASDVTEGIPTAANCSNSEGSRGSSSLKPAESVAQSACILGSLKTLREYYSGIEKKDQTPDRNRYSSPGKLTNTNGTETSVSTLQPAIGCDPRFTKQLTDGLFSASASGDTGRQAAGSSTGRILPELRSASCLPRTAPVTLAVTSQSDVSVATNVVSASREDAARQKRSSAEDDQPVPPKKRRKLSKSAESPDGSTDEGAEDIEGAEDSSNETGGGLTTTVENGHVVDDAASNAETSVNGTVQTLSSDVTGNQPRTDILQWNTQAQLEPNHPLLLPDEDGDLPLHIAVVQEDLNLVRHVLHVMAQFDLNVDCFNKQRQTPLHFAVITGQVAVVKSLLEAGASPNCPDRKGLNSLHLAVWHGKSECLKAILTCSRVDIDINAMNYEGLTALHLAVKLDKSDLVELLLNHGANVNVVDGKSGHSPLYMAAQLNQMTIATLLLHRGASVQLGSYYGCTPIQAASARAHHGMVKLLLQNGAVETSAADKTRQEANEGGHRKSRQKIIRQVSTADQPRTPEVSAKPELTSSVRVQS